MGDGCYKMEAQSLSPEARCMTTERPTTDRAPNKLSPSPGTERVQGVCVFYVLCTVFWLGLAGRVRTSHEFVGAVGKVL